MLYDAYLRYPRAFYDRHATGEVISRATNDIYPVRYFIGWGVVQAIQSVMMLVGAAIVLVTVNARLALFAALAMPPIAILTYIFAHKVFPISRVVQAKKGHLTEATDEAVVGIEMVQAFGREDDVRDRFGGRAEAVRDETMRQAGIEARFLPGLIFLPSLGIAAVLYFGGRDAIAGTLTIGEFTLFITLLLQLVWPLEALGWIINLGQRATAAASRSFAWLDAIEPLRRAARSRRAPGRAADDPDGGRPLQLRHRQRGAVGRRPRGSPGRDRRRLRRHRRRQDVAAQPAAALLRPDLGARADRRRRQPRPGARRPAPVGRARDPEARPLLRAAARQPARRPPRRGLGRTCSPRARRPGVAAFVDDLPDGYDTLIGERGVNLSGGQRQRVALARALIAGARVIVLDDPMSAVDTETERHLVETLRPAVAGRTVLIAGPAALDDPRRRPRDRPPGRPRRRERAAAAT